MALFSVHDLRLRPPFGSAAGGEYTVSATEAKNCFGQLMERAMTQGVVAITLRNEPRAVLLSIDQYSALLASVEDPLDRFRGEFDELVAKMQTPEAVAAGEALFAPSTNRT